MDDMYHSHKERNSPFGVGGESDMTTDFLQPEMNQFLFNKSGSYMDMQDGFTENQIFNLAGG